jgi:hypothetical protein
VRPGAAVGSGTAAVCGRRGNTAIRTGTVNRVIIDAKDAGHYRMPLKDLLAKARKREFTHLATNEIVLAGAIMMAGLILLLLTGTQVLDWYWLALLAAISAVVGLYRLRKSAPSLYALAQRLDRRLKLSDALSTAVYFFEHPRRDFEAVCELQRRQAEAAAREIDPREAVPGARPRYLVPAAVLTAAALALFGVRYLVTGSMDLRPSLIKIAYDSFFSSKSYEAKNLPPRARFDPKLGNSPQDDPFADANAPEDLNSQDGSNGNSQSADDSKSGNDPSNPLDDNGDQSKQDQSSGDPSGQGKNSPDTDKSQQSPGDSKNSDQNGGQDSKNSSPSDSSLMNKLRDALANMMNKMKSTMEGDKSKNQNSEKGAPGDKQDSAEKGEQSKENQQSQDINGDTQAQNAGQQSSADTQNGQSAKQSPSQDSKNGIGSQNGDKAVKEAEQLQAMGKITEILGKRSANVTGEVMMEVGSGKQTLKTPWIAQQANHAEAGSEIHRDEVPLMYQQFVEQYFEQIRASEPKTPGKATDKTGNP